jgi:hypothetical protein
VLLVKFGYYVAPRKLGKNKIELKLILLIGLSAKTPDIKLRGNNGEYSDHSFPDGKY